MTYPSPPDNAQSQPRFVRAHLGKSSHRHRSAKRRLSRPRPATQQPQAADKPQAGEVSPDGMRRPLSELERKPAVRISNHDR